MIRNNQRDLRRNEHRNNQSQEGAHYKLYDIGLKLLPPTINSMACFSSFETKSLLQMTNLSNE